MILMRISPPESALVKLHRNYGASVGKHFPLWACVYTALTATSTVCLLVGKGENKIAPRFLENIAGYLRAFLGPTGCRISLIAGGILGGATFALTLLPACGKGLRGFQSEYQQNGLTTHNRNTIYIRPSFLRLYIHVSGLERRFSFPSGLVNFWQASQIRVLRAIHGVALVIFGSLDLIVSACVFPAFMVTAGRHRGYKNICLSGWMNFGLGLSLSSANLHRAIF